jgi:hypothetical protein
MTEKIDDVVEAPKIEATDDIFKDIQECRMLKSEIKALQDRIELLSNRIKFYMDDKAVLMFNGCKIGTLQPMVRKIFNAESFKDKHPDMYAFYQEERVTAPVLRLF